MKLALPNNKDFWAGLMFTVIGALAMFVARDYRFGSASSMGSGFFPTLLGAILIAFGICIMAVGLRSKEKIKAGLSLRALIILPLSIVLFGQLMEHAGYIPALMVLILVAAASSSEFKVMEALLFAAVLTLAMVAVFIWGLGLAFPLFGGS